MVRQEVSSGKVLLAEPFMLDPNFKRSAVLVCEHNEEGSFGLILNKPVDMFLHEMIKGFPEFNARVYLGGPVKTDNLYFIHTQGNLIENSMEILDGLYWGGEIEHVKELIMIGKLQPNQIKFYVGYAGWVTNQLEGELERNSWLVANIRPSQVMASNTQKLWDKSLSKLGGDYSYWINFPSDPNLN